ncbi:transposase [Myxococcus xanthus]|uniref:transposase n=1 Tax=Myxococcus xanthus TaxID=34 RepID=UPI00202B1732|nr:transposase [Myxococcus xanthus]
MIERAVEGGVAPGVLLADSAYGNSSDFRARLRALGLHYAAGVAAQTGVRLLDAKGRPRKDARSDSDLAWRIHERGGFRRCTWRQGTQGALSARFALRCVVAAGVPQREQEPLALLI